MKELWGWTKAVAVLVLILAAIWLPVRAMLDEDTAEMYRDVGDYAGEAASDPAFLAGVLAALLAVCGFVFWRWWRRGRG